MAYVPTEFQDYHEPFLGGGALFFAMGKGIGFRAHLSDVNGELVNAYRVVKERPDELIQLLSGLQTEYDSSENPSDYFYRKRDWQPADSVESASRLIFLNKTCYNGLYRVNSHGKFNVPFGRYKKPTILDADNIRAVSSTLNEKNAQISCSDYKDSMSRCRKNDFVYLDPPYQPKGRTSSFTQYSPGGFSRSDQVELANYFRKLVDRGCKVVLSNSETSLTSGLYGEYKPRRVKVNRPINSVGSGRTGYAELIVLGNLE